MWNLFWLVVGAFVGWNVPRPKWAAKAQRSVIDWIKEKVGG